IYTKNKNEYKNKNSLLKNFKDASLNEIKEISKEQDVFLKIDIRENKNNDYTYRNLICENIEKILSYNIVDVIINDKEILRKIKKEKKLTYKSLDVKKRTNIWSYKNNEDILSLGELKNYLSNSNEIIFLFGKGKRKRKYVISNLDENISLEDLRLLGFAFTDGSFYNKKIISFYNNDISNIEYYNDLIYKRLKRYNKTKNKNFGEINSKYEKSWRKRMSFFNDFFFLTILVTDNNFNKNIDIEILSKLSCNQFLSFYGGCLDGDGYIQEYAVSLCNYENNIKKIVNLLMWNGCLVNQNENYVSIPSNEFNRKFIENIEIKHSKRKIKKQNLSFKEIKNSISKDIKWFIYDDFAVVNIKEIKEYDDYVNMFDMKTETSYFSCNGIKTHNCMSFDVPYIINRCKNLGIELSLSPINQYKERRTGGYHIDGGGYTIAGISILDGLELYKNFVYTKRERYSLQFIGKLEVEEGKKDLEGTVNTAWKQWNEFVEYNIQDVLLCKKIEDKKKHIQLTINFCYQALIPFDRIFSSISVVTGYMLRYLHERNIVFPDKTNHTKDKKFPGAYVMAKPGYYEWLVSFDIASMYPHLIMQYNISPETLVLNPESEKGLLKCPLSQWKKWETAEGDYECGGIYYRKDKKGILAEIVEDIYNDRKKFKSKEFIANAIEKNMSLEKYNNEMINIVKDENESSEYYYSQQQIRKILINSIYGVLGNPYFNFFNINNAIAVTLSGQHLIRYLSDTINSYMKSSWHKVGPKLFPDYKGKWNPLKKAVCILVDTDSNYLCLEEIIKDMGLDKEFAKDYQKFLDWVLFMENNFFNPFFNKILNIYAAKFGVEQKMVFKREKIITQKFILAKKKYADEIIANEDDYLNKEGIPYTKKPKISITGIEVVRTDT
ncbi:MAG: DNA polymerase domain-containing protein, partial [Atribacterota bacterium]